MVYGLGSNTDGCLGLGHNEFVYSPQEIPELCHQTIQTFIIGYGFVLAMNNTNHIYSWGHNIWGQLGRDVTPFGVYLKAERISYFDDKDVQKISCGSDHSLALTSNGKVYGWGLNIKEQLGVYKNTYGIGVAVKKIDFTGNDYPKEKVLKEVENLIKVKSQYVVQYYDSWTIDNCLYIQMELCSQSLRNILEVKAQIIHRDLKPENILIAKNVRNVHDKRIHYTTKHTADVGDIRYIAPESSNIFKHMDIPKRTGTSITETVGLNDYDKLDAKTGMS
ncbi:unnamed protein product [Oppiella nova]|uniref:Protein kinase domain-containing protein n=1 Tax=Oppiella nova TaxID=334625 RepID=A0A7R9LK72_9ACAR|nr:unnamed protein product [Oppiella nova]CAG2164457.1 unnamed protein product [Oppiella nova]